MSLALGVGLCHAQDLCHLVNFLAHPHHQIRQLQLARRAARTAEEEGRGGRGATSEQLPSTLSFT